jgi:DNA-binding NarL/FixJ family response regulator
MSVPPLSPVEGEIVLLVAAGDSTQTIADGLGVSVKTVEWHLERARQKLERAAILHDRLRRAAWTDDTRGERDDRS